MLLLILLLYTFVCMGASYDGRVTWDLKNRFPAPAATFNNTWSQETLVNTMHAYMRLALKIRVGAREWEKREESYAASMFGREEPPTLTCLGC